VKKLTFGETMRQAIGYCRVSTLGQAEREISIPAQMNEIEAYAKSNGIEIVEWFKDEGVSAYHDVGRDGFEDAIRRASQGDIDLFLVHDTSRFCRDRYSSVYYKRILRNNNVTVLAVSKGYDPSTETGVILEAVDEALAMTDSMRIAKHTIKGMKQNVITRDPESGYCYKNGGRAPYGYGSVSKVQGRDSRGKEIRKQLWEIHPQESETLLWIYGKLLEGWGYKSTAIELNSRGIKTSTGGRWTQSHIREFVYKDRLMTYAGYGIWNRTHGGRKARPESEWIIVPNAHPAIIKEEMIPLLAKEHRRSLNPVPRVRDSRFLLTGQNAFGDRLYRVDCGDCQGYMTSVNAGSQRYSYYACSQRVYHKRTCDKKHRVPKEQIETLIIDEILENFGDLKTVRKWAEEAKKVMEEELSEVGQKQIALRRERVDLVKRQGNLYEAIENGLPFEQVKDRIEAISKRLREIEAMESALLKEVPEFDVEDIMKRFNALRDELLSGGETAKQIIKQLLAWVVYHPDTGKHKREYMFVSGLGGVGRGTHTIPLIRVSCGKAVLYIGRKFSIR